MITLLLISLFLFFKWLFRKTKKHFNPYNTKYWNGPKPTFNERAENLQYIVEHLKRYPQSWLAQDYPYEASIARASVQYEQLNRLRDTGQIEEEEYQIQLSQLLPLIDISEDIQQKSHS